MIKQGEKIKMPRGFLFCSYGNKFHPLLRARTATVNCASFSDCLYFTSGKDKGKTWSEMGLTSGMGDNGRGSK